MIIYTTCTNLETCSQVYVDSIDINDFYEPCTKCRSCGSLAFISREPLSNDLINDDALYLQNLITLDQIANFIGVYEKQEQGIKTNDKKYNDNSSNNK